MNKNYKPPFLITDTIINQVSIISELLGRIKEKNFVTANLKLRKTNRIKTVYSSLAIEQNTLTLEQVTAILNGKHIIAPQKDVIEVTNAYDIYNNIDRLNPYSVDDILFSHRIMMKGLIGNPGEFRDRPVGVADNNGNVIHIGSLPEYVPSLIEDLIYWTQNSETNMLIKSCVFHYEFELIHPFLDGNGRIGRLWHTLLLSKWNNIFSWLPVESIIFKHQSEYYNAINTSNINGESSAFIEFMLSVIIETLKNTVTIEQKEEREKTIIEYINKNSIIYNSDIQKLFGVSSATSNRILNKLVEKEILQRVRSGSKWGYTLK